MTTAHSLLLLFLAVLCAPSDLFAEWRVATRSDYPSSDEAIGAFDVNLTDGSNDFRVMGVRFSASRYEFRVVPNLRGIYSSVRDVVDRQKAVAGVNGGYFKENSVPIGLRVSGGETIHPFEHARLLSGVFLVRNGNPELRRTAAFAGASGIGEAIQSGPFLIEASRPVSGLDDNRKAPRTFVFATTQAEWGIGICRSATLAQLAQILAAPGLLPHARVTRALNLDGGSSTTFYLKLDETEISSPGWAMVSDYLIVTPR